MKYTFLAIAFSAFLFSCNKNPEEMGVNAYKAQNKEAQEEKIFDSISKEAQQTLDDFKLAYSMKDTTTTNFMLQEKFEIQNAKAKEGIWIGNIFTDNDTLKGVVNSQPQYTKLVKLNDTVTIDESKISDWMYYKADKMIGGYTIKYIRSKLSDAEKVEFDKQYKVKFED